jgi:hypothetical protein
MVERTAAVVEHYGRDDLRERLSSALRTAGLSGQVLSPMILAPLDQFHVRGLAATKELAERHGSALERWFWTLARVSGGLPAILQRPTAAM